MSFSAAVPFVIRRSTDVMVGPEITTTQEDSHGLLHIEVQRLKAQWTTSRAVTRVGRALAINQEQMPLREVFIPLAGLAGATVRRRWFPPRWQLVLRATDLRAFTSMAEAGLPLPHPAELVLDLRGRDRETALTFVAELGMALADLALLEAEDQPRLNEGSAE